jgi:micrococcal nuclease
MGKKVPALAGVLIAGLAIAFCWLSNRGEQSVFIGNTNRAAVAAQAAECPVAVPELEGIAPGGCIRVKVTKVTDGDTIKAEYEGEIYKVRLMYIDTPETVKEGVAVQPYGKEASDELAELLDGKAATLVFEKDLRDDYGRLLAFAFLKDGTCINVYMVDQGFARVEAVKPNTAYRDYFENLQENAIRENRGLWSLPPGKRPFVKKDEGYYVPRYY